MSLTLNSGKFARARQKWRDSRLRFPAVFLALLGAMWLVYTIARPGVDAFQTLTVLLVTMISNVLGLHATSSGSIVTFGNGAFAFDVEEGCTGIAVAMVICAAIWAYPAPRVARIVGVLIAAPLVLVVNIVRLVSMGWAGIYSADLFDWLHLYAWQIMVVLIAGLGFFAWARISQRGSDKVSLVAKEVAKAFGIFALVFTMLWVAGHFFGVAIFAIVFKATLRTLPVVLGTQHRFGMRTADEWLDLILHQYFTWAGFFSLFLATPRLTWKRRILGAIFLMTPMAILPYTLFLTFSVNAPLSTLTTEVLDVVFGFGVPLLVWVVWARSSWKRPGWYTCPACNERHDDILVHIREAHPIKRAKIMDEVRRTYPELANPTNAPRKGN